MSDSGRALSCACELCVPNVPQRRSFFDQPEAEPQVFVCDDCEAKTPGVVSEAHARSLGFWSLCGTWHCADCDTFDVVEA